MKKIAYVFPGQGSQYIGMGMDIFEKSQISKDIFEKADKVLNQELKKLCFEGPLEELTLTYNTQPALLTTSVALYEAARELLPKADFVAGHSLGEYSALVVSGALSFEEAVYVVKQRGQFMNDAVPSGAGAMSAVMGMDKLTIKNICNEVSNSGFPVQIANLNTSNQIVISGSKEGVKRASELLIEKGTKRIINLPVSGPFHSELMKPASEKLISVLDNITINDSKIPVISNVDATARTSAREIKETLISQVYSSVLWEDSITYMIEQGVDTFIEIGSGKVLSGLIKKIDKNVSVFNIYDSESLNLVSQKLMEVYA